MELLIWLFVAVLVVTYGGALIMTFGAAAFFLIFILEVTPWWVLIPALALWFVGEYLAIADEEDAEAGQAT